MMSFPTFLACVWEVIQGFLKTGEGDENGNGGNRVHPLMHTQDDPQLCNESILDKHLLRSVQVGLGDLSLFNCCAWPICRSCCSSHDGLQPISLAFIVAF